MKSKIFNYSEYNGVLNTEKAVDNFLKDNNFKCFSKDLMSEYIYISYGNLRETSLKWWHLMTYSEQINVINRWKDSLEKNDTKKNWDYRMIRYSDSVIELIYKFIKI